MKMSEYTDEMCKHDYNSECDDLILRAIEYRLYQMHLEAGDPHPFKLKYFEDDTEDNEESIKLKDNINSLEAFVLNQQSIINHLISRVENLEKIVADMGR